MADARATSAATLYDGDDPLAVPPARGAVADHPELRRAPCCGCALPFVGRADVDLARDGDELVVTVGSYRRLLTLPAGLARHRVAGARVDEGELQVRFAGERSER